ncbi:MAG TPA: hypothetical protein VEV43_01515 [Actinomycetota bacterium]|nr:hypothetical protein [Actinomycetota bacterium]
MRKKLVAPALIATALAVWPASPAGATHNPCIPSDQVCIRIQCPNPSHGAFYIYIDSRGLPFVDFTDCAVA